MVGPLLVKVFDAQIPDLSEVNEVYWTYRWEKHELEGLGYACPRCGRMRIVKSFVEESGTRRAGRLEPSGLVSL